MTQTLEALKSGKLMGSKTLTLSCGLKEFPEEILSLSDTLEVLDLSDNQLSELPDSIAQLKKLKILFFARNEFTVFPKALALCPELSMIGFKTNQIHSVPENAFPAKLQWLILTDNKITSLPKSIGQCGLLQKFALAGNLIEELPVEMNQCKSLELLRVSANKLKSIPQWLFELPKLSWVAFGGNPASHPIPVNQTLDSFNYNEFTLTQQIGEGASGVISKAHWNTKNEDVAIKVFKGAVTSDGSPEDEMGIAIAAGAHENLIPVLGKIKNHPDQRSGLLMKLISPTFINLGNPPNWDTCTRDVFNDVNYTENELLILAKSMASVCAQLHGKGINHGDFYAHNILINKESQTILGDFGAASYYDVNSNMAPFIERIEVSAFGCLIDDILGLVSAFKTNPNLGNKWHKLIANCFNTNVANRPNFSEIIHQLNQF